MHNGKDIPHEDGGECGEKGEQRRMLGQSGFLPQRSAGAAHPLFWQKGPWDVGREASGHLGLQLRVVASRY